MTRDELMKLWVKVTGKFNALIGGAPEALDTLKEIADKLGDDDDALAGLLTQVGSKQDAIGDLADIRSGASKGATAYQKPSGGIPKSDLASAVQTSLGKADTALQSFTESDPTVPAWAKVSTKPSYNGGEVTTAINDPRGNFSSGDSIDEALSGISNDLTSVENAKQDTLISGQNIKSINGHSVLGAGNLELGELFVVTMTQHNSVYTADKSVSEIYAACYTNGKPVIAVMRDINNPVLILTDCDPDADSYVFSAIESNVVTTLRWQQTDDYTYELETMLLQPRLVSGTNIKTVNNENLLGSGNVTIADGEDGKSAYQSYVDTTSDSPVKTEAQWIASLKGDNGVGFASASSPTTADGTWQITLTNGDTITIDLNHVHPQYETVSPITNAASGALTVNEYRDFGSVSALTVTLTGGTMTNYDLYKFAFTCASDATTLTLPSGVKLPVDMEMEMATGRRFECVIDYANCLTYNCWD